MGCFGNICKGCGTPINGNCQTGGEKCVLIHVRHGKEVGRVEGHYDEYGRVIEQEGLPEEDIYRGDNDGINGHSAICDSEFSLDDSYCRLLELRIYKGQEIPHWEYTIIVKRELSLLHGTAEAERIWNENESNGVYERQFAALPTPTRECYSGTAAWHSLCYHQATSEAQANLLPSETDPDQSWGRVRKKFK